MFMSVVVGIHLLTCPIVSCAILISNAEESEMRTVSCFLFTVLVLCSLPTTKVEAQLLEPSVIYVPLQRSTIQEAIDNASDGDTIIISDGIYTGVGNRDISYLGKSITVRSENGPEECIIDCEGSVSDPHRGFRFQQGEGNDSILQGITIRNGHTQTMVNHKGGGAIICEYGSPTIEGCIFEFNVAGGDGGAILLDTSSAVLNANTFRNNNTNGHGDGGAIAIWYCYSVSIINNNIYDNSAVDNGGGIYGFNGNVIMSNNVITNNHTSDDGGGIYYFSNNGAWILSNNVISDNDADNGGGIGFSWGANCDISNTVITGNSASESGGGIHCVDSDVTLSNCILFFDSPNEISVGSGQVPSVYCSDVEGGYPGELNIDIDPEFCDASNDDYHLPGYSPCAPVNQPECGLIGILGLGCSTIAADMSCMPTWGTLPFNVSLGVILENLTDNYRTIAARIDVTLANETSYLNYRSGFANLLPLDLFERHWTQVFPAYGTLLGENKFNLVAEDVTPSPYNQPPFAPSGDTDTSTCAVTGIAP